MADIIINKLSSYYGIDVSPYCRTHKHFAGRIFFLLFPLVVSV